MSRNEKFNKTIWMCWFQGENRAPPIVKSCINSWRSLNPNWNVRVVDDEFATSILSKYLSATLLKRLADRPAAKSDLLRLAILTEFGGVWVDATTLCVNGIDAWLDLERNGKFYCFDNGAQDRSISSWFLVAEPESGIMEFWLKTAVEYWVSFKAFPEPIFPAKNPNIHKLFARYRPAWFAKEVKEGLCIYPYFWMHYIFDVFVRQRQDVTECLSKKIPLMIGKMTWSTRMTARITKEDLELLQQKKIPVIKLTHKYNAGEATPGTIAHYVTNLKFT